MVRARGSGCIVKLEQDKQTKSGLFLAEQYLDKPDRGTVVSVGPGRVVEGRTIEAGVSVGDKVLFSRWGGSEFEENGEAFKILECGDLIAVIEGE